MLQLKVRPETILELSICFCSVQTVSTVLLLFIGAGKSCTVNLRYTMFQYIKESTCFRVLYLTFWCETETGVVRIFDMAFWYGLDMALQTSFPKTK